jgi:hypothetical protein
MSKKKSQDSAGVSGESPSPLAKQLMELHLAHEMSMFDSETFVKWLASELNEQWSALDKVTINQLVCADQIKQVIVRNVVTNDIPGSVTEIAGDAASQLFTSDVHRNTLLKSVMTAAQFEEFVDKLLDLPEPRKNGIDHVIDLPIYRELISGVLYQAIVRYIYEANVFSKNVPGVSSMLKFGKRMIDKTAPKLEGAVEESVKTYIAENLVFLVNVSKEFLENSLTDEDLKDSALELWDMIESKSLGEFQEGMDSVDLSEFVVLGYEFWLRFRTTDYFKSCYELVVDYFFEKYGEQSVQVLLEDLAINPSRIMDEAQAFAPSLLNAFKENGQLESLLRRRLAAFYESASVASLLSDVNA